MNDQRGREATGKLGVLLPGMGAVASTFIAGCLLARRGLGEPIGSVTELGNLELGPRANSRMTRIRDVVPLAAMSDFVFGGWDIFPDNALEAARHAGVLEEKHLTPIAEELAAIEPMPAAFYPGYVKRLSGTHVKRARSKADMVEQLREDIRVFKRTHGVARTVAAWCGSTEIYLELAACHQSMLEFNRGLLRDDPAISNTQLYAWACLLEGVPFVNATPNLAADFPAGLALARERGIPLAGKDLKTGQTLVKTILAPGFKARLLGLHGWFSTNILGNRDGEVLDDPASFHAKEVSKLGSLERILDPGVYPSLYGEMQHKVRIEYYRPRGDAKEGWDNVDLFGWLGYPMQLKIDFLCRDSILAAPLVLDLLRFIDLAARAGFSGPQEWLSFFFKSPLTAPGVAPEHDLFVQEAKLKNALRRMSVAGPGDELDGGYAG